MTEGVTSSGKVIQGVLKLQGHDRAYLKLWVVTEHVEGWEDVTAGSAAVGKVMGGSEAAIQVTGGYVAATDGTGGSASATDVTGGSATVTDMSKNTFPTAADHLFTPATNLPTPLTFAADIHTPVTSSTAAELCPHSLKHVWSRPAASNRLHHVLLASKPLE